MVPTKMPPLKNYLIKGQKYESLSVSKVRDIAGRQLVDTVPIHDGTFYKLITISNKPLYDLVGPIMIEGHESMKDHTV